MQAGERAANAVRGFFGIGQGGDLSTIVRQRNSSLKNMWFDRNKKMKEWYDAIKLTDYLEQEDMESYITNQPKNAFRFARHLLVTSSINDKVDRANFEASADPAFDSLEIAFKSFWKHLEDQAADSGKQGWLWQVSGFLTSLGWYSVFHDIDEDEVSLDVWNPYQVFPLWHPREGLVEVVREYSIDKFTAERNLIIMGRPGVIFNQTDIKVINHWVMDEGVAKNTLLYGNHVIKDRESNGKPYIPVITGPASGMPDQGVMEDNPHWSGAWGEAVVAHNLDVLINYNKMQSFVMQVTRDAANPRWVEYVNGGNSILDPEDIFKRGAIFTAENDERVEALSGPVIPVEATVSLRDMRADIGTGSFNDTIMGDISGPISSVMLSTMISNTRHLIDPYSNAIKRIHEKANSWWWGTMKDTKWKPHGVKLPINKVESPFEWKTIINLNIPGDITNRATQSRMISPEWSMSETKVNELLWGAEIDNANQEMARKNAERANRHPVAVDMQLIQAYEENADRARAANDLTSSARWKKAAAAIEAQLGQRVGGQQPEQVGPSSTVVPNTPNPFEAT